MIMILILKLFSYSVILALVCRKISYMRKKHKRFQLDVNYRLQYVFTEVTGMVMLP